jgi:hypothetical protein
MVVYPGVWGRPVARTTPTLPAPQHFGAPAVAELEPGDRARLRGEHLHASEINVTDETRYVLTVRFTASAPRYGEGFLGGRTPTSASRAPPSRRSRRCARASPEPGSGTGVSDAVRPSGTTSARGEAGRLMDVDLSDLAVGEVRGVSPSLCVVRTERGVFALGRRCRTREPISPTASSATGGSVPVAQTCRSIPRRRAAVRQPRHRTGTPARAGGRRTIRDSARALIAALHRV